MFLSTVIVAIVTLMKPFDVMRRPAIRDLGFFLVSVLYVFYILYKQTIKVSESVGKFVLGELKINVELLPKSGDLGVTYPKKLRRFRFDFRMFRPL